MLRNYLTNDLFEGITGKREYLLLKEEGLIDLPNTVLIAIHDPSEPLHRNDQITGFQDVIQLQFWDLEEDVGSYQIISDKDAEDLAEFIHKNKNHKFFIHCAAGQSRSAGTACAVECIVNYGGDVYEYKTGNSDVKNHPRYSPNWTVFDKIMGK